ncbi:MAG: hypothetical protein ACJ8G1_22455 [Vitreoscilla sp.]
MRSISTYFQILYVRLPQARGDGQQRHVEGWVPLLELLSYARRMMNRATGALFSLNGLSLMLGALGAVSGFVTMFVDVTNAISVKWLLATVWVAVSLMLVLLKVIFDLHHEKRAAPAFEVPIKYLPDKQIFVIRRNENFLNNIVVGCYSQQDEVDTLICIGVVHIVQEKAIQIKLRSGFLENGMPPASQDDLLRLQLRPVVPIEALNLLQAESEPNE